MSFEGSVIAVTGGGSGIGAEVGRVLAAAGAHVVVLDRDETRAKAVAAEVGGSVHQLDVSDEDQVDAVYADIGRLDGLVNCAGFSAISPIVATSLEKWRRMTAVHLDGTFLNLRAAAVSMLHHGVAGSIVNIASVNGSYAHRGMAAYAAAKAGISQLTRVAALELAEAGIRVNAVGPGIVETPMTSRATADPAVAQRWAADIPLGRLGRPVDIARIVAFLLGGESAWMTGQTLIADGGVTLRVEPKVTPDALWTAEALRAAADRHAQNANGAPAPS